MRRLLPLLLLLVPGLSLAQDPLDDLDDLDELPESIEGEDDLDLGEEPAEEPPPEEEAFLGEEEAVSGSDSADVYRAYQEEVAELGPEEQVRAWERYLERYPDTPFRARIERRIEELMDRIYGIRILDDEPAEQDALQTEILFAQGLLLENINPRTRIQAGFEYGLPTYLNLFVGYEHALWRELSVHGAIRNRYTGYNVEAGVSYALVKSLRTKTLVTAIADLHFNVDPAFLGIRPQIAAGKIFGERLHAQVQVGADFEARRFAALRLVGGANLTWMPAESVALFAETTFNMKGFTWTEGGLFRFNVVSFGLKFYPRIQGIDERGLEMNVGASAPYTSNYWMYHFGSVMGQVNYYP